MCRRWPKWHRFKGSIQRLCPGLSRKKKDVTGPPVPTPSKRRISGRKEFKDDADNVVPILKPPTKGARRTRTKHVRGLNHVSSTKSDRDSRNRNTEVKIRLSMAEEEVISPSPIEKREERFQRPSLEQRQKLLAIAQDITHVMDAHHKERSASEKSSRYGSRLVDFLSRASHRPTKDPKEQVETKLKAIEERIVQVEKEISQTSQQASRFRSSKSQRLKAPFKFAEKAPPILVSKGVPPSLDLYPKVAEPSLEQASSIKCSPPQRVKSHPAHEMKLVTNASASKPAKQTQARPPASDAIPKTAEFPLKERRGSLACPFFSRLMLQSKRRTRAPASRAEAAAEVKSTESKHNAPGVTVGQIVPHHRLVDKGSTEPLEPGPRKTGWLTLSSTKYVEGKPSSDKHQQSPSQGSPTTVNSDSDPEKDGDAEEVSSSPGSSSDASPVSNL